MPLIHDCMSPFGRWDFHVFAEADWDDPLPQFLDADETPYDLTGVTLALWVRPNWDHSTILLYCSTANGRITVPAPATDGLADIHVSKTLIGVLPAGQWKWFLRASTAAYYREFARGDFYLHPGQD